MRTKRPRKYEPMEKIEIDQEAMYGMGPEWDYRLYLGELDQRISRQSKEGERFAIKEEINTHELIEDIIKYLQELNDEEGHYMTAISTGGKEITKTTSEHERIE